MVCIYCGNKTSVRNSRPSKRTPGVWRRRQCEACQTVFTTREYADLTEGYAVQRKDGSLQPFSRDHLFISVYQSCKHRQTALEDADALTHTILIKLLSEPKSDGLITTSAIIGATQEVLAHFDSVAATCYGAYYA